MQAITGQYKMDAGIAGAFREYFRPLELRLINKYKELNEVNEPIGWSTNLKAFFLCYTK